MGSFSLYYKKHRIPEWRDYYINYDFLKIILSKIKKFRNKTTTILLDELISNITEEEFKYIENLKIKFENRFIKETEKFNTFFKHVYNNSIKVKLFKIILNIHINKKKNLTLKTKKANNNKIKEACERYYKEITVLRRYVSVNVSIIYKTSKKYKKTLEDLQLYNIQFIESYNEILLNTFVFQNAFKLRKLLQVVERTYLNEFFPKELVQLGKIELEKIKKNKQFSSKEAVKLGFFVGTFFASLIGTILILIEINFFSGEENDFVKFQMPIFRGALIIYLYWFFLGLNVYVWDKYNINYKRVFNIQLHHSSVYQIFKRVFGFLSIWMIIFLYSAMSFIYAGENIILLNKKVQKYMPPFVWITLFLYMIFPSKKKCNGKGRAYLYKLLKDTILSPFLSIAFLVPWVTDQMLSLVIPLKDLSYTICYSVNVLKNYEIKNSCKVDTRSVELVIIFMPLVYRFIQCLKKAKRKVKWDRFLEIVNAGKYFTTLLTTFLSLYQKSLEVIYYFWIVFLFISTFYSYLWDVIKDWGFFEKNTKHVFLRNRLYYPKKYFYYLAIIFDLGLRFTWTLTISPNSLDSLIYIVVLNTGLGILETFRRTLWNYFKVELENVKYEKEYSSIEGFLLPFEMNLSTKDKNIKKFINKVVENQISEINFSKHSEFLIGKNFRIDDSENYLKNYLKIKDKTLDKKKYEIFNRSLEEEQLKNFQSKYQCFIDDQEKDLEEKDLKLKNKKKEIKLNINVLNEDSEKFKSSFLDRDVLKQSFLQHTNKEQFMKDFKLLKKLNKLSSKSSEKKYSNDLEENLINKKNSYEEKKSYDLKFPELRFEEKKNLILEEINKIELKKKNQKKDNNNELKIIIKDDNSINKEISLLKDFSKNISILGNVDFDQFILEEHEKNDRQKKEDERIKIEKKNKKIRKKKKKKERKY